jgi:hypothetical protein
VRHASFGKEYRGCFDELPICGRCRTMDSTKLDAGTFVFERFEVQVNA